MKNNADVDFVISEDDMTYLKNVEHIKDYGSARIMPVFGGELKFTSIIKNLIGPKRK
jgi:hypothetical protein